MINQEAPQVIRPYQRFYRLFPQHICTSQTLNFVLLAGHLTTLDAVFIFWCTAEEIQAKNNHYLKQRTTKTGDLIQHLACCLAELD